MNRRRPNVNWHWVGAFVAVLIMFGATMMTMTISNLLSTTRHVDDTLECILYELNAHRLANQHDHDTGAEHHGYEVQRDNRPNHIPDRLRDACEAILPGITGDGTGDGAGG